MALYLVEGPTDTVLDLDMLKTHLRVDTSADDDLITLYYTAAEKQLDGRDGWLGRALVSQTWEYRPSFVGGRSGRAITLHGMSTRGSFIQLPLAPLLEVISVEYYDQNNELQTLSTDVYEVVGIGGHNPGRLVLKIGQVWPVMYIRAEPMVITFRAGYIDTDENPAEGEVPAPIRAALLLMVGDLYAHRETILTDTNIVRTAALDSLLASFEVAHFGD